MSVREAVLLHLRHTLEEDSTQPSLATATAGLTAAQALWKPTPERHSVWQIAAHLINFHEFILAIVEGWDPAREDMLAMATRAWSELAGSQAEWERDRARLQDLSHGLLQAIEQATDERLNRSYMGRRPLFLQLHFVASHTAYHTGQIRFLRAMQGI